MVSATFCAWTFPGVERSLTSWPAALRLSEALKVENRTSRSGLGAPDAPVVVAAGSTARGIAVSRTAASRGERRI